METLKKTAQKIRRRASARALLPVAAAVVCGCVSHSTRLVAVADLQKQAASRADSFYQIGRGDVLHVKFRHHETLNEETTVRPDGRISVQVAHDVYAAGITPEELSRALEERCREELVNPEITVIVRTFSAQRAYVSGEVTRPGMVPLNGRVTVLQAIAETGGLKETARMDEIVLIRRTAGGSPIAATLNLKRVVDGSDPALDVELLPYDIVFVPRSRIANLNLWVDQFIRKTLPLDTDFGLGYRIDDHRY